MVWKTQLSFLCHSEKNMKNATYRCPPVLLIVGGLWWFNPHKNYPIQTTMTCREWGQKDHSLLSVPTVHEVGYHTYGLWKHWGNQGEWLEEFAICVFKHLFSKSCKIHVVCFNKILMSIVTLKIRKNNNDKTSAVLPKIGDINRSTLGSYHAQELAYIKN